MGINSYGFREKLKPSLGSQVQLVETEIDWT